MVWAKGLARQNQVRVDIIQPLIEAVDRLAKSWSVRGSAEGIDKMAEDEHLGRCKKDRSTRARPAKGIFSLVVVFRS